MKYPIGIQSFEKIRQEGCVYIDKTDLVYSLVHEGSVYFLSRPRRFGKSLLLSTLEAYFLGKKELFKGLKIDALETEWRSYPVFHMDFGKGRFEEKGTLEEAICGYLDKWEKAYGIENNYTDFGLRFADIIEGACRKTGTRCVVLIDEYDKPLLDVMSSGVMVRRDGGRPVSLEEHNRSILKGLYSTFKGVDASLQFVFLAGVTKFSQVSVFSGFNQPTDISMSSKYDTLCGITADELDAYFTDSISRLSAEMGMSTEETRRMLIKQYDGYHFSKKLVGVLNPFSLLNAFEMMDIQDYWFRSGTPTYLIQLLNHTDENIDDLVGKYYPASQFIDYKADKEMPLPMIYQSGYLTIKDYKRRTDTFLLDFPNDEVKRGFTSVLANNYFKSREDTNSLITYCVDDLYEGNIGSFITRLTAFFASIPYSMRRRKDKEQFFHYTFYLLLRLASTYVTYTEKQQSQGRVDCVIETDKYIYIFEFKLDGTAEAALKQIDDKGYAVEYAADSRKLFKVGVNFSSETGTVSGWKVEE